MQQYFGIVEEYGRIFQLSLLLAIDGIIFRGVRRPVLFGVPI